MFQPDSLSKELPLLTDTATPFTFQAIWVINTTAMTESMRQARENGMSVMSPEAHTTLQGRQAVFDRMAQSGEMEMKDRVVGFSPHPALVLPTSTA